MVRNSRYNALPGRGSLQDLLAGVSFSDESPNGFQLLITGLFHFQRSQSQLTRASGKKALAKFSKESFLSIFLGDRRTINVGAISLIAFNEAFFRHDLQQFQNTGIDDWSL